jgi:DNA-binding transcriptional MerR regulator
MRKYQAQTYSIGNVAKMTGATKKQISNWEASGHIPKADRIQYGDRAYRRFSLKQVELISKIRELRDEGYTLPAAAEKAKTETLQPGKESRPGGIG